VKEKRRKARKEEYTPNVRKKKIYIYDGRLPWEIPIALPYTVKIFVMLIQIHEPYKAISDS